MKGQEEAQHFLMLDLPEIYEDGEDVLAYTVYIYNNNIIYHFVILYENILYHIILCYIISYYVMLCFTLRFIFTFIVIFYYFLFCFVIFDGSKIVGIRFSRVLAAIIFQVYIYIYIHT